MPWRCIAWFHFLSLAVSCILHLSAMSSSPWRDPSLWNWTKTNILSMELLWQGTLSQQPKSKATDCGFINAVSAGPTPFYFVASWSGSDTRISSTRHSTVFLCLRTSESTWHYTWQPFYTVTPLAKQNWQRKMKSSVIENNFTSFILYPKSKFYTKKCTKVQKKSDSKFTKESTYSLCARHQPPYSLLPSVPAPICTYLSPQDLGCNECS